MITPLQTSEGNGLIRTAIAFVVIPVFFALFFMVIG